MRKEEIVTLPVCVQDYLNYLNVVKNKSELTVLEYASDLRMFTRFELRRYNPSLLTLPFEKTEIFSVDIPFFEKLNLTDAYAFLSYCKDERKDDSSARARKTVSVKRFYKYLFSNNLIKENNMVNLEAPKIKKSLPKYLTLEQSLDLLNSVEGKNKERDYCILTFFLNCGLRLAELVSINLSDFSDEGTLRVVGKGNKERTIYINDACAKALNSYLRVRPVDGVIDKKALFLSNQKKRISPKTVQHMVNKYLDKAGLGNMGFSVHKLRHTAATLMYQHGNVDVLLLKEILGHENLATTEIYTHVINEQLRNAVDSNPLNNPDIK
ncbi:MAG: tyrosine recombinase XerC [Clostridia bacterium]|nr:tyrosine recombinase XerC [Clostridia bacterium]